MRFCSAEQGGFGMDFDPSVNDAYDASYCQFSEAQNVWGVENIM